MAACVLHPVLRHFFRFWLWFCSGTVTREWVAVHRRHHAYADRPGDPHSPVVFGLRRVLLQGYELYVAAARDPKILANYGRGTPDDWLERNLYSRFPKVGISLFVVLATDPVRRAGHRHARACNSSRNPCSPVASLTGSATASGIEVSKCPPRPPTSCPGACWLQARSCTIIIMRFRRPRALPCSAGRSTWVGCSSACFVRLAWLVSAALRRGRISCATAPA